MSRLKPVIRFQENSTGPSGARRIDPHGRRAADGGRLLTEVIIRMPAGTRRTLEEKTFALPSPMGFSFARAVSDLQMRPFSFDEGRTPQDIVKNLKDVLYRTTEMGEVLHQVALAVRNSGRTYATYDTGRRELDRRLGGDAHARTHLRGLAALEGELSGAGPVACILSAAALDVGLEKEVGVREAMLILLGAKRLPAEEAFVRELVVRTCVVYEDRPLAREMGEALLKLGASGEMAIRRLAGPHEGGQDSMGFPKTYRKAMMELMEK